MLRKTVDGGAWCFDSLSGSHLTALWEQSSNCFNLNICLYWLVATVSVYQNHNLVILLISSVSLNNPCAFQLSWECSCDVLITGGIALMLRSVLPQPRTQGLIAARRRSPPTMSTDKTLGTRLSLPPRPWQGLIWYYRFNEPVNVCWNTAYTSF